VDYNLSLEVRFEPPNTFFEENTLRYIKQSINGNRVKERYDEDEESKLNCDIGDKGGLQVNILVKIIGTYSKNTKYRIQLCSA